MTFARVSHVTRANIKCLSGESEVGTAMMLYMSSHLPKLTRPLISSGLASSEKVKSVKYTPLEERVGLRRLDKLDQQERSVQEGDARRIDAVEGCSVVQEGLVIGHQLLQRLKSLQGPKGSSAPTHRMKNRDVEMGSHLDRLLRECLASVFQSIDGRSVEPGDHGHQRIEVVQLSQVLWIHTPHQSGNVERLFV